MRAKVVSVMRWYAQDEVNQEDSEQNEVDGMKKGADSTGKVMHMWKSGWWFLGIDKLYIGAQAFIG